MPTFSKDGLCFKPKQSLKWCSPESFPSPCPNYIIFIKLVMSNTDLLEFTKRSLWWMKERVCVTHRSINTKIKACSHHQPSWAIHHLQATISLSATELLNLTPDFSYTVIWFFYSSPGPGHSRTTSTGDVASQWPFPACIHLPSLDAPTRKIFYLCNSVIVLFTCIVLMQVNILSLLHFPLNHKQNKILLIFIKILLICIFWLTWVYVIGYVI